MAAISHTRGAAYYVVVLCSRYYISCICSRTLQKIQGFGQIECWEEAISAAQPLTQCTKYKKKFNIMLFHFNFIINIHISYYNYVLMEFGFAENQKLVPSINGTDTSG